MRVADGWWGPLLRPWDRLGVRVAAAILAAVGITATVALLRVDHAISSNAEARLNADVERAGRLAQAQLDQLAAFTALAAGAIAARPDVAGALARGDVSSVLATASELRGRAPTDGGAVGLTVYDATGAVLIRAHAPLLRDQAAVPLPVQRALGGRAGASGVRVDQVAGLALVAAAPVLGSDGRALGAVETLVSLDEGFARRLAAQLGMPVAVLGGGGGAATSQAGWVPATAPRADGQPHGIDVAGREHVVSAVPLRDAAGEPIATLITGNDRSELDADRADAQREVAVAVAAALAAGALLALVLNALTLRPLRELARAAARIRGGDLHTAVPQRGPAELRALGAAMEGMRGGVAQARAELVAANEELAAQAAESASGLTAATTELAVMHAIVSQIAREPAAGAGAAVEALLRLDWVDGAFVALAGADGRLTTTTDAALGEERAARLVTAVETALAPAELAAGVFYEDVAAGDGGNAARHPLAEEGVRALAVVPLTTPQGVAGLLGVVRARPVEFGAPRRFLLEAIGDELAGAIERAELADEAGEHRRLAEAVLREMSDGVLVLDGEGRCRVCNPAALRLLRLEAGAVLGAPASVLPLPAATVAALRARAREGSSAPPLLAVVYGRELALGASPFGVDGAILLVRDLTAVAAAERAKQDFVSMVGHELRTPLTLIRTSVDLLCEEAAGPLNATQRPIADVLRSNADRLQQLISDLLDMSAIDSGRVQVHPVLMDLGELVRETVAAHAGEAEGQRIALAEELPAGGVEVWADRGRVRQVLQNLVHNALKYTPAGGHVTVRVSAAPAAARIDVTDDGIGVPPAEQPRLFEKFYRTRAGQRHSGGTGLGLAIARSLVELHGGEIWCESDGTSGSTFSFTLPREPAAGDRAGR